ncbi:hypothetical protein [Streptomyces sp. NPDC013181]|uniref:hypothetical protein n=1 Tax=Streptomyces sp. NPDC013181 TaxID=3364864 RepID=UPI0036C8A161
MGARPGYVVRVVWRTLTKGLFWSGFAMNGVCPPYGWRTEESALPSSGRPSPAPLSDAEFAQWTALVRQLN